MKRVPRAAGVLVWTVGAVALHAVVPFELSRLGDRVTPQGPAMSARRGAGLLTVVAGAALMAWAMTAHYQAAPRGWALDSRLTPGYLLRRCPYRFGRNPMYAGEAVIWLGWAVLPSPGSLGRARGPVGRVRGDRAVGGAAAADPLWR